MKNKKYTWRQLKKFVNQLPEKELKKEVRWWGDERGGSVKYVEQLKEDFIDGGYGAEPASSYSEEELEDMNVIFEKGTPIISVD